MKYLIKTYIPALFFLVSCASTSPSESNGINKETQQSKQQVGNENVELATLSGLYFARLPCPGCGGSVRVNLLLEKDYTYDKTEEYLGSNEIFFENGRWEEKGGKVILTSNSSVNTSTIRLFEYSNHVLTLLTEQGTPYIGGKKGDYLFRKK